MKMTNSPEQNIMEFRNHPIIMVNAVLLIPLLIMKIGIRNIKDIVSGKDRLRSIMEMVNNKAYLILLILGVLLLLLLIIRSYLVYKNSVIIIGEKTIQYKKYGLLFKNDKESRLSQVTNVNLNSGIAYSILGIKKVVLDINSSETAEENDYSIVLSSKEAEKFRQIVMERKEDKDVFTIDIEEEKLEGQKENRRIKEYSKKEIIKSAVVDQGLLGIVKIVVVIVVLFAFRKIVILIFAIEPIMGYYKSINKIWDFKAERVGNHLKIRYGLSEIKEFDIDIKNIIGTGTEQNLLARMLGMSVLTIDQIGFGNTEEESNRISLYMKEENISEYMNDIIPEINHMDIDVDKVKNMAGKDIENVSPVSSDLENSNQNTKKNPTYLEKPSRLMYYYIIKSLIICEVLGSLIYVVKSYTIIFPVVGGIGLFIGASIFSYKRVIIEREYILFNTGIFSKKRTIIPYKKIESITCKQSIIQKKIKVESLEINYRDYKQGKANESTGLFEEGTFDSIIEYYSKGEK